VSDDLDDDLDIDLDNLDMGVDDEAAEEAKKAAAAKKKKKKIILIAVGVLILLLAGGGGAAWKMHIIHDLMGWPYAHEKADLDLGQPVSIDMPMVRTDLKSGECRAPFVKFEFTVQVSNHDVAKLNEVQPQIMDGIRTHLRDQERQDLVGKQGSLQLKSDLAAIINHAIKPSKVRGILFKDLILQ